MSEWVTTYDAIKYGYYVIDHLKWNESAKDFKPICAQPTAMNPVLNWRTKWDESTECYIDSEMLKYCLEHLRLTSFNVIKGLTSFKYENGKALF